MAKTKAPVIGTTCPALTNENYKYHLSGDAEEFCICAITGNGCFGRVISDPDDQSSQFFSRGKCSIDSEKIKRCPLYGVSKETLAVVLKDRAEREFNDKVSQIK
jgi:hypothetical protein